ncbi:alpha-2,8-polysialyltransferase family protein [Candidatus Berkiella cookevillensis]|uniref:Alpha-2,8-polysialyltransferase family protein n=1 Tax=Candidatus Berkiella cookevillensis TaxID=437022 RepID=A0A0Q9YUB3_9GAMM|nr:hypothetical protein [Candidatus Berkiella cookevillensis]MCS5707696.1 alpha-2,8-polysialyltransferase family protein [Candidatus Berkiella cookevillensis]
MLQRQKIIDIFKQYKTAHLYCADPGAYAVLSVLYHLLKAHGIEVCFYCDGWAATHSEITFSDPCQIKFDIIAMQDILVLGSQLDFGLTYGYLQKSLTVSMATVFIFDHWKNYLEHFTDNLSQSILMPNYVFFPDQLCQDEFEERVRGLGLTKICFEAVITGHLAIEHKMEHLSEIPETALRQLKEKYKIDAQKLVLILLDPENTQESFGFTLEKNLTAMYEQLSCLLDEQIMVLIKPHPRQDLRLFSKIMSKVWNDTNVPYHLVDETDPLEILILISQEVWGITTMGLVLAKRMGKPIKSFQICRNAFGALQSNSHIEPHVVLE